MKKYKCHDCGMELSSAAEYHPRAFCILVREGIDPWSVIRETMEMKDPSSVEAEERESVVEREE